MRSVAIAASLLAIACGRWAQAPVDAMVFNLAGTSWQLVKFVGGDGATLHPDEPSKYTLAFGTRSDVRVRFDCNRSRAGWHTMPPNKLEFGRLFGTRAVCESESLHDHIMQRWMFIRTYDVRNGNLFLVVMDNGGSYEFKPVP